MYAYSDKKDLHFHSYLSLFHAPLMELLIYNLFVRYRNYADRNALYYSIDYHHYNQNYCGDILFRLLIKLDSLIIILGY